MDLVKSRDHEIEALILAIELQNLFGWEFADFRPLPVLGSD